MKLTVYLSYSYASTLQIDDDVCDDDFSLRKILLATCSC